MSWWKTATGYQIYPRSFADSNGDGIGDLGGILSRLDHLADLGVGFIWLSPVYSSPMVDNGYDISNYRDIAPEFGSLGDMDALIAQAQDRGIRIVMDLVVNHCSDQHRWFQTALKDPTSREYHYFIWRDAAPDGGPPTDHQSYFGGPMWTWAPSVEKYYFHQFSPQQPDLNWRNAFLRAQIYDMMNWWLDRGIGGFRMDVIDLIGKDIDAGTFAQGPYLARYLQEMQRETLEGRDVLTVGESWSVTPDTALMYCGRNANALDMVFQFGHIQAGWHPDHGKWHPLPFDLVTLKANLFAWQEALADDGWNSLYWSNHDLPRAVSKYGHEGEYRERSAKALALALHMMRGTPFVYQGEEIAMTNATFTTLSQFRDIETHGMYKDAIAQGRSAEDFIAGANANGRDTGRTPMQWQPQRGAGFTTGTPWIDINPNHRTINVQTDRSNSDGVFNFYKHLIQLRKSHRILTSGRFIPILEEDPNVIAYLRADADQTLLVLVNLTQDTVTVNLPTAAMVHGDIIASTQQRPPAIQRRMTLQPYAGLAVLS